MATRLSQITAITELSLQSMGERRWSVAFAMASVGLVILTLLAFLAMANGFVSVMTGTGARDVIVVMSTGADSELVSGIPDSYTRRMVESPGIKRGDDGKPLVSEELYLMVSAIKKADGSRGNIALRGVTDAMQGFRDGFKIIEGRMPEPGSNEIIVGAGAAQEFKGLVVGEEVRFGHTVWKVSGVFAVPGTVFDSEVWGHLPTVQAMFYRQGGISVLRARLEGPEQTDPVEHYFRNVMKTGASITIEYQHYARQAGQLEQIVIIGWILSLTLALGGIAGTLTTMYGAVEDRWSYLISLRAIGFGPLPAFVGALVETLVLAIGGGLIGIGLAWAIFNGLSTASLGTGGTQIIFEFALGQAEIVTGLMVALALGLVGGLFPATKAARAPITPTAPEL